MVAQPLAYESLKTVLQYMEPNLRFMLSNRIPSITSTEKAVPLKIKHLMFSPYEFVVNGTSYKLTTYRHYPPNVDALQGHQDDNSTDGVPYDLDQYGFADYSQEDIVTPGNVVIKDLNPFVRRTPPYTEDQARLLDSELEIYKWTMARKMGRQVEPLNRNLPNYYLARVCQNYSFRPLQHNIDRLEKELAPVYCRRNNTGPLFSSMVQFTVKHPNRKKEILWKAGDMKLYQAQDQLATRLFGNRIADIFVKHLEVRFEDKSFSQMVIRLPSDFQIKVREMTVLSNAAATCDALKSLIHTSSYPLEQLEVYNGGVYPTDHPTIRNAKKLIFDYESVFEDIAEFLTFQNEQIYLRSNQFDSDEHITLLRNWIANRRKVGTCYVSHIEEKNTITETFEKCKELLNGSDAVERCVKVPMSESSEINVSYESCETWQHQTVAWMLTIKIVAV